MLGDEVELTDEGFVLTQNDKPTVIGGVVGGKETGIDASTTKIVLDAGNYNQIVVKTQFQGFKNTKRDRIEIRQIYTPEID